MIRVHPFVHTILVCAWLLGGGISSVYAEPQGMYEGSAEGQHFMVYFDKGIDGARLEAALAIGDDDRVLSRVGSDRAMGTMAFPEQLDVLFMRVCDILDMQVLSYKGTMIVVEDHATLARMYANMYPEELKDGMNAFYVPGENTIYVSLEGITKHVLGHEIAHAVISSYFVVLPSMKIQEVLAGYVEYQLRKS